MAKARLLQNPVSDACTGEIRRPKLGAAYSLRIEIMFEDVTPDVIGEPINIVLMKFCVNLQVAMLNMKCLIF